MGAWMKRAACLHFDPELFHDENNYFKAKLVCETCPVLPDCRDYVDALEEGTSSQRWVGVWGGEAPKERARRRGVRRYRKRELEPIDKRA